MIGISTWCHLIIPKAAPFLKDGSFPRSPATTSGQQLLSCISKDAPGMSSSQGSFQLEVSVMAGVLYSRPDSMWHFPTQKLHFSSVLCLSQRCLLNQEINTILQERTYVDWGYHDRQWPWFTEFASVLRGFIQSGLQVYSYLSCMVMGKYTVYTYPQHRWALGRLAVLPAGLLVKANLMQNLLTFLTQRPP